LAGEFVAHAIRLVPRVYTLLKLTFLESDRRSSLLESGALARVLVFRDRLPMMHRDGYAGRRIKASALAFAWFIWSREHRGDPVIARISARGAAGPSTANAPPGFLGRPGGASTQNGNDSD
jgi:hypothetical protein